MAFAATSAGARTLPRTSAPGNVLANGRFESGLQGWWGFHARLTRLPAAAGRSASAHAVVRRRARLAGVLVWPRIATSLPARSSVHGLVRVRATRPGALVCVRVRDVSSDRVVGQIGRCTRVTTGWQTLATPRLLMQAGSDSIGFAVFIVRPRVGDELEVDDAKVPARRSLPGVVAPAPPGDGSFVVGINANAQGSGDPGAVQSKVVTLGIRHMREDFVHVAPGAFDRARWDRIFASAAARHVVILPLFTNPADYQDDAFIAAAVARYGPGGTFWRSHPGLDASVAPTYWEVGNEPYFNGRTAQDYARDFRAAVIAGRRGNPAARFLVAAYPDWYDKAAGRWEPWVDAMYAAVPRLNDYMGGWTVHPYTDNRDPALWRPGTSDWNYEYQQFRKIHSVFAAHGAGSVPMWITEIGWTTHGAQAVTAGEQAQYMLKAIELLQGVPWAKALFYYQLQDWGPRDDNPQHWYGILQANGAPKPAYGVLKQVVHSPLAR